MKSFIYAAVAALATSVIAAPAGVVPSNVEGVNLPSLPATGVIPSEVAIPSNIAIPSDVAVPSSVAVPSDAKSAVSGIASTAKLAITVVGLDSKNIVVELASTVAGLLIDLGLPELGVPVGKVIKTADSVSDLVKGLAPTVKGLITVVDKDGNALLIQFYSPVAALVAEINLPAVTVAVGFVFDTVSEVVKRDIVQTAATEVDFVLTVAGKTTQKVTIQLVSTVARLLAGLGLGEVSGTIIAIDRTVEGLIAKAGSDVTRLITVVDATGSFVLIQLAPGLAGIVLPILGTVVGTVLTAVQAL